MKKALSLLIAIGCCLTGCATVSPPDFYRPAGSAKQYEITAQQHITDGFSVAINGEKVMKVTPSLFGNAVEGQGTWQGKRVRASFVRIKTALSGYTRVSVFIDGDHAATLTI